MTIAKMICPSDEEIARAAEIIRRGGLVAFPTETVYGLGANALDPEAVARIFAVKRRPLASPLIVHVSGEAMARTLTADWPERAHKLAARFWPGPLTLVLKKARDRAGPGNGRAGFGGGPRAQSSRWLWHSSSVPEFPLPRRVRIALPKFLLLLPLMSATVWAIR